MNKNSAFNIQHPTLLILRFSALGDIAMTLPAIYSLAHTYPGMEIYVATRPFFGRMFINPPVNVKVITFDLKDEYKGIRGTLRIARQLADLHPDYVADLHNMARTMLISTLLRITGAKVATVDKARSARHKVYNGGKAQRQYIDRYFDTFRRLGLDTPCTFTSVYDSAGLPDVPVVISHPAVGIAPYARYATKTYPPELMRNVARTLAAKGINVYLFGGRGTEADTLATWNENGIISLAGQYPLEQEIAIMGHLDVMVSMDSANQHLAALAGTKVVTVWGSTTPACGFLGFGQTADNAVCLNLPCQPCTIAGSKECPKGHMHCLTNLPPQTIVDKITRLITHLTCSS